jgi:glycosyltransferase involved in cell wall biosynthesis
MGRAVYNGGVLISVLLPARNAESTLREALDGVFGQRDAPPFEVVCVDDASTDATPKILAESGARVVRGEGRGLVAALNLGLAHCRGGYIARMDADDVVHPDRLRLQIELLEKDRSLGAVGSLVTCDETSPGLKRLEAWLNATVTKEQCRNARFIEAPLVHPSTTFRREALNNGWEDHGWAEDWDLLLRLVEQGWELAKVPHRLLHWRDLPHRLTRTHEMYGEERMFKLRAHYLARGPLKPPKPFDIWGAGPTGKRLARELEAHGLRPRAFFDVDRNKRIARGRPVLGEKGLPPPGDFLLVCAVGAAGAREEIRSALDAHAWVEGRHFLFAA